MKATHQYYLSSIYPSETIVKQKPKIYGKEKYWKQLCSIDMQNKCELCILIEQTGFLETSIYTFHQMSYFKEEDKYDYPSMVQK